MGLREPEDAKAAVHGVKDEAAGSGILCASLGGYAGNGSPLEG